MTRQGTSVLKRQTIPSGETRTLQLHEAYGKGASGRRWWYAPAAVFALALVARLTFQIGMVGLDTPPSDDAALYDSIAISLTHGGPYVDANGYRSRRAPAFPFLLAGVYAAAGHSWPAARLAQAVLGALTCSVLLFLGRSWLGPRIGLTAALACAVFPYTIFWSGGLVSEPLCTFLATSSTWALTKARGGARWTALWSLLCALTTLTRPNMALLLPLGLAWLLCVSGRRWVKAAVAVGIFCLALLPWTVRNYRVHHRLVPLTTMGGVVLWQGNNPIVAGDPELRGRALPGDPSQNDRLSGLPEVVQDRLYFHRALDFMMDSASKMPGLVGRKLLRLWNPFPRLDSAFERWLASLTLLPVMTLFAAGLTAAWRKREGRILPLVMPVLAVMLTAAIYWADARIRAPADPVILLLASYGLWSVLDSRMRHDGAGDAGSSTPLL